LRSAKKELARTNKEALPKGFGALSMVKLDREIGDYQRFSNRRKVGSFGGLFPKRIPPAMISPWVR
jgi:hypothetical protein